MCSETHEADLRLDLWHVSQPCSSSCSPQLLHAEICHALAAELYEQHLHVVRRQNDHHAVHDTCIQGSESWER